MDGWQLTPVATQQWGLTETEVFTALGKGRAICSSAETGCTVRLVWVEWSSGSKEGEGMQQKTT